MKTFRIISIAFLLIISLKSYSTVHVIKQSGTSFTPTDLIVIVGDIVRWEWSGGTHTTTSKVIPNNASAWDNPLTSTATSFEYTVTVAGVYTYVCKPHESMGMIGSFTVQVASSINENATIENLSLYPNPASSFINISSSLKGKVVVSNILGERIKNINQNDLYKINDEYRVDLSDLTKGLYFITIIPSDYRNRISAKFIKN